MAKHKGQLVGYVRVSTLDQHTERQLEGMKLVKIFTDKASGKDTVPPAGGLTNFLGHHRRTGVDPSPGRRYSCGQRNGWFEFPISLSALNETTISNGSTKRKRS